MYFVYFKPIARHQYPYPPQASFACLVKHTHFFPGFVGVMVAQSRGFGNSGFLA
jgi:hypothetical protein